MPRPQRAAAAATGAKVRSALALLQPLDTVQPEVDSEAEWQQPVLASPPSSAASSPASAPRTSVFSRLTEAAVRTLGSAASVAAASVRSVASSAASTVSSLVSVLTSPFVPAAQVAQAASRRTSAPRPRPRNDVRRNASGAPKFVRAAKAKRRAVDSSTDSDVPRARKRVGRLLSSSAESESESTFTGSLPSSSTKRKGKQRQQPDVPRGQAGDGEAGHADGAAAAATGAQQPGTASGSQRVATKGKVRTHAKTRMHELLIDSGVAPGVPVL